MRTEALIGLLSIRRSSFRCSSCHRQVEGAGGRCPHCDARSPAAAATALPLRHGRIELGRPLLLDLYCGAGGAAEGYWRAGYQPIGVDVREQPRYPFPFACADATSVSVSWSRFAAAHASPPCQRWSVLRFVRPEKGQDHPDLITPTRAMLEASGLPYVIENVPGAPLESAVTLCGSMFDLGSGERQLRRHRLFEANFPLLVPSCRHRGLAVGVYGDADGRETFGGRGGYQGTREERQEAMQIGWMNDYELTQAIPPAYTSHLGRALRQLEAVA
jgi:DNA (cytosine-5)-methyltransferase 1